MLTARADETPLLNPHPEQGTTLLAVWRSLTGLHFSVWDSFGTHPFKVFHGTAGVGFFATCGILMRIAHGGSTVVLRTNMDKQFQCCWLGEPWPAEWFRSLYLAAKTLVNPSNTITKALNGAQIIFSAVQNHVALGRVLPHSTMGLLKSLSFTAEGQRRLPERATMPKAARAVKIGQLRPLPKRVRDEETALLRRRALEDEMEDDDVDLDEQLAPEEPKPASNAREEEAAPVVPAPVRSESGQSLFSFEANLLLETFVELDPRLPFEDQGQVLLAQWVSSSGHEIRVFDSYGVAPFHAARDMGVELFATCGVLMRVTAADTTLVVRTNADGHYQCCRLGTTWPPQWTRSLYMASKNVAELPLTLVKWFKNGSAAKVLFSLVQNHVTMGRKVLTDHWYLFKSLQYTPQGEQLMSTRVPMPMDEQDALRVPRSKKPKRRSRSKTAAAAPVGGSAEGDEILTDSDDLDAAASALVTIPRGSSVGALFVGLFVCLFLISSFSSAPAAATDANHLRPVPGQGEELLAVWTSKGGYEFSLFDSYGDVPFRVAVDVGASYFATTHIMMRIVRGGTTLVLRSNDASQFQLTHLGQPWPLEWHRSVYLASKHLAGLSDAMAKWFSVDAARAIFSAVQNHVTLGRAVPGYLLKTLTITDAGRGRMSQRASFPKEEPHESPPASGARPLPADGGDVAVMAPKRPRPSPLAEPLMPGAPEVPVIADAKRSRAEAPSAPALSTPMSVAQFHLESGGVGVRIERHDGTSLPDAEWLRVRGVRRGERERERRRNVNSFVIGTGDAARGPAGWCVPSYHAPREVLLI